MKNANYRKHNDRQMNSSTYHKKDGTNIRAILKREAEREIREAEIKNNIGGESNIGSLKRSAKPCSEMRCRSDSCLLRHYKEG